MKRIYFFFTLFITFASSSCSDHKEEPIGCKGVLCSSYIPLYYTGDTFYTYNENNKDNNVINIIWGERNKPTLNYAPEIAGSVWPENDFMKYATRNNDLTYNSYIFPPELRTACSDNFRAIHVVAADDWDEKHPAGTLLDELFTLSVCSYAPYIRSGYDNDKFDPNNYNTIISKRFSELTADDLCILDIEMVFIAESAPADKQKIHELTFTFVTDEGVEKPTTIRYSWADGVIE